MAKPEPVRVSGKDVLAKFDAIQNELAAMQRLVKLYLAPTPMYVYKPRPDDKGAALKLHLRLSPVWNDKGFVQEVEGGLFLELVAQAGKGDDGFARFGWQDETTRITAKLGIPDITSLLVGIRNVRQLGKPTPQSVRAKGDEKGITVSLFHKFGDETTAIEYKFGADGSYLRVSKSKDWARSIKLTLQEELQMEAYLRHALNAFHRVGA